MRPLLPVVLTIASTSAPAIAAPLYAITPIGTPGSVGTGINASGEITGYFYTAGHSGFGEAPGITHAFLWNGTSTQDLGTLGGRSSAGYAINASGQVTGYSDRPNGSHAFLWNSSMQDLGTLGGSQSYGYGINASGQVTGYSGTSYSASLDLHAFLWNGASLQDLGTLGGTGPYFGGRPLSYGRAVNDTGQVTGYSNAPSGSHAFLWNGASMQDLGPFAARSALAMGSTPTAR